MLCFAQMMLPAANDVVLRTNDVAPCVAQIKGRNPPRRISFVLLNFALGFVWVQIISRGALYPPNPPASGRASLSVKPMFCETMPQIFLKIGIRISPRLILNLGDIFYSPIYFLIAFAKHFPSEIRRSAETLFSFVPKYADSRVKARSHSGRLLVVKAKFGLG